MLKGCTRMSDANRLRGQHAHLVMAAAMRKYAPAPFSLTFPMAACVRSVSRGNTTTQADIPDMHPAATRCAWLRDASPETPEGFIRFFVSVS